MEWTIAGDDQKKHTGDITHQKSVYHGAPVSQRKKKCFSMLKVAPIIFFQILPFM